MRSRIQGTEDARQGGALQGDHRGAFVIAVVLCLLVACGGGGSSSPTSADQGRAELEQGSFQLVNAERTAANVSPRLIREDILDEIARLHSELMRDQGFFSHTDPQGRTVRSRLEAKGYFFTAAGENIAKVENVVDPAGYAHQLLMGNPGHRRNILGEIYQEMGVGVAIEGRTVWITQIYVRRTR